MAKKGPRARSQSKNRPRSTSEKIMMVLGILIALSMVLALFGSFASHGF